MSKKSQGREFLAGGAKDDEKKPSAAGSEAEKDQANKAENKEPPKAPEQEKPKAEAKAEVKKDKYADVPRKFHKFVK